MFVIKVNDYVGGKKREKIFVHGRKIEKHGRDCCLNQSRRRASNTKMQQKIRKIQLLAVADFLIIKDIVINKCTGIGRPHLGDKMDFLTTELVRNCKNNIYHIRISGMRYIINLEKQTLSLYESNGPLTRGEARLSGRFKGAE